MADHVPVRESVSQLYIIWTPDYNTIAGAFGIHKDNVSVSLNSS